MTLEATEAACAAVATAPRVTLASMEAKIAAKYFFTMDEALRDYHPVPRPLEVLPVCVLVMQNGFTIIGKAAPASAANFNRDLGQKLAYDDDAIRQLWPLEGYLLRESLYLEAKALELYGKEEAS